MDKEKLFITMLLMVGPPMEDGQAYSSGHMEKYWNAAAAASSAHQHPSYTAYREWYRGVQHRRLNHISLSQEARHG
jgi:hypothetical protein